MNITRHAFERMLERGFTPEMLGKFLNQYHYRYPSKIYGLSRITGKIDGNMWTIVVTDDMSTLVTIRRAHKDEIEQG